MEFHVYGNKESKVIVFIHGILTPWQIWQKQIDFFKDNFYVIVPALDGHVEEKQSEFVSIEEEVAKIEEYLIENDKQNVYAICGLSMGGVIANKIFENRRIEIDNLIIDGGPLVPINRMLKTVMTKQYLSIVHKAKERNPKVLESFKKDFLPEMYLENFLKFADTMTDTTIENMLSGVCESNIKPSGKAENTRILFMHGTVANESVSKVAAAKMKSFYPNTTVMCFKGLKHIEMAIYNTDKWIEIVNDFLSQE